MSLFGRRAVLEGLGASAAWLALGRRGASAHETPPISVVPLSFAVATEGGTPVEGAEWIEAHVAEMEQLMGPLGIHPRRVGLREIDGRFARLETRQDRDALAAELRPHVVNVFVVGTLVDVDEAGRLRRGVHWRNEANVAQRYVILSTLAAPGVLAHEMGHYFGLGHTQVVDNLMSYERTGGPVFLDAWQARIIQRGARQAFASGELLPPSP
jgi:hypothetical protein